MNGECSSLGITETFATAFEEACMPWDRVATEHEENIFAEHMRNSSSDFSDVLISQGEVNAGINSLNTGKAADIRGFSAEHLQHADVSFEVSCILTAMLRLCAFPSAMNESLVFPLLKSNDLNKANSTNYRGIAVAPVLSKVYEAVFSIRNAAYLKTHSSQYAYKTAESCGTCAHAMLSIANQYRQEGSTVHLLFVDASKAFDKVVHPKLCTQLLERGVPPGEVLLFKQSLVNSRGRVRIDRGPLSRSFGMDAGVRQGSLLGGTMWAIYMDGLLHKLQSLGVGCQPTTAFAYADDICLAAPTAAGLQLLVEELEAFARLHQIKLNPGKSWLVTAGKSIPITVKLSDRIVQTSTQVKYLGFDLHLHSRKRLFRIDDAATIQKFFRAANGILGIPNCSLPMLRLRLLKTFACPIVDYLLQLTDFIPAAAMGRLQIALNKVARRACGLHRSCSTNLACAAAGWFPISIRSGQLRCLQHCLAVVAGDARSDSVARSRINGCRPRTAALAVFHEWCSPEHIERARNIRGLLAMPDKYARAMVYNISKPSCL